MKTRNLTVEPIYQRTSLHHSDPPSYLRLKGYWLTRLGFKPGDKVMVTVACGRLMIRKRKPAEP